ncbi:hypothetical protein GJ496_010519 [Pomphorhynchus laevis]|nr:hypothetical protein GJ496_010519 [Pomphorhynchus laevis]
MMSVMAFDKAREIIDVEKDWKIDAQWSSIGVILTAYTCLEKNYYSLNLWNPASKYILRKEPVENIKSGYNLIQNELSSKFAAVKVEDIDLQKLSSTLNRICQIRILLIDIFNVFYANSFHPASRNNQIICALIELKHHHIELLDANFALAVKTLLNEETEIFRSLLSAEENIWLYKYLDALLDLHNVHFLIRKWINYMSIEGGFFGKRQPPAMVLWFSKMHESLVAKFGFHFHFILQTSAPNKELKQLTVKSLDCYNKVVNFVKKNPQYTVGLVVHSDVNLSPSGFSYYIPTRTEAVPIRYCLVFNYPLRSNSFWYPILNRTYKYASEIDRSADRPIMFIVFKEESSAPSLTSSPTSSATIAATISTAKEKPVFENPFVFDFGVANSHTDNSTRQVICQRVDCTSLLLITSTAVTKQVQAPPSTPVQQTQGRRISITSTNSVNIPDTTAALASAVLDSVGTVVSSLACTQVTDPILLTFINEIVSILRRQRIISMLRPNK